MTNRNTQITSVVLSAIMVLSVVAFAFGAGAATTGNVADSEVLTDEEFAEEAEIKGDLLSEAEDGPVTAIVRLGGPDSLTGSGQVVVDQLKAHAEATQQPVIESAEGLDSATVDNTLWITNAVVVTVTEPEALEELSQVPGVDRIHPNYEYEIPDVEIEDANVSPDQDVTYGLDQINAPDVWDDFGNQGEGAKVAVLDSGYYNDHPNLPEIHPDDQWQEWDDDGNPVDSDPVETSTVDHGTHVSGTIVGSDDPEGDVPAFGVAPEAELYNGLVLPGGGGSFVQVAAGMEWAVDEWGVDVINMSLGGGAGTTALVEAAEHIWEFGAVLVASNGNNLVGAPGTYWSSFGSQAVDEGENPASFADFAEITTEDFFDWGGEDPPEHWPDEYITPHASAAGVGVLSAQADDGHAELSGTSMSAPHHAGMFALMVAQNQGEPELEEFREIALETAEPPEDDPIFGAGISDAHAAVDEVQTVPEFEIGDVNEDGNITIADAIALQQHLAGLDPEPFNENTADINRDESVGVADAVLLQQFLAGQVDQGFIDVTALDAPEEIDAGETLVVDADFENTGGIGAVKFADLRLAEDEDDLESPETTIAQDVADLGPGATANTIYELPTDGIVGGDYSHGVFAFGQGETDGSLTADITINNANYEIVSLEAPEEADQGDTIEVTAEIENIGNVEGDQDVEFAFAAEEEALEEDPLVTIVEENVTIDAGDTQEVTFEPTLEGVPSGEYFHGAFTEFDNLTAGIDVFEPIFELSDLEGPDFAERGDEMDVSFTVENTGGADGTQNVTHGLGGIVDVAVIGHTEDDLANLADRLDDEDDEVLEELEIDPAALEEDPGALDEETGLEAVSAGLEDHLADRFEIDTISYTELEDDPEEIVPEYDVHVVSDFGDSGVFFYNEPEIDLEEEWKELLDDDQGVVYLDSGDITESNAVQTFALDNEIGGGYITEDGPFWPPNPDEVDSTDWPGFDDEVIQVEQDHEIFDDFDVGVGEEIHIGEDDWSLWIPEGEFEGDILATGGQAGGDERNPTIGVTDRDGPTEFFHSTGGVSTLTDPAEEKNDNHYDLLASMVESAGPDAETLASQQVTLDTGESMTVSLNPTVPEDFILGESAHLISSDDDQIDAPIEIVDPEQINVADVDAPAEVLQDEVIDVTVDLEHVGSETTTQDVEYVFNGTAEGSEEVTLDPGEETTVTIDDVRLPVEDPDVYQHGVQTEHSELFVDVEMLVAEDPFFEVTDLEAPDEIGQGFSFNASATVTNIGQIQDTQTIEYEFNVEEDDDDDGPGAIEDADVAFVDGAFGEDTDELVEELAEELQEERDLDEEEAFDQAEIRLQNAEDHHSDISDNLDDEVFTFEQLHPDDLLDEMDSYDVFVIHDYAIGFGDEPDIVEDFLDDLADDQGVVLLEQWGGSSDAISDVADVREDPDVVETPLSGSGAELHIQEDHEIFNDVGDAGDTVPLHEDTVGDRAYFEGYTGDVLGESDSDGDDEVGPAVAIDEGNNEALLASFGLSSFVDYGTVHENTHQTIANAVEWSTEQALPGEIGADGADTTGVLPTGDDGMDITPLDAEEIVTLDGNESEEVTFEFLVPDNQPPGIYDHGIFSDDDEAIDEIVVFETSPDIVIQEVSHKFNDTVTVGDTINSNALVINQGDAPDTRTINYLQGGQIIDNETVSLDPDEVEQINFGGEVTQPGDWFISVNGQFPEEVTVKAPDVEFNDQATASSSIFETGEPGVELDVEESDADVSVLLTDDDLTLVGLETDVAGETSVAVENTTGFPGDHIAHLALTENVPDLEIGDEVPAGVADEIVFNDDDATVFLGEVTFENQTVPGVADDDDLTVDANLAGDADALYTVDLHETDEDGDIGGFVGTTDVISGEVTDEPLRLEDTEGNDTTIDETDEFVAMVHLVDDDSEEGDEVPPGTFPVLAHSDADGSVPGGVTDSATVEVVDPAELAFADQATASSTFTGDDESNPGVVVDDVSAGQDSAVVVTYEETGLEAGDEVTIDLDNVAASAWEVSGVSGATDDIGDVVVEDVENPTLTLVEGVEYTFEDLPGGQHPLQFNDENGTALLSQDSNGTFEDDPDVGWVNDGEEVTFTLTESLAADLDGYVCTIHTANMEGGVQTSGEDEADLVIAGLDTFDADELDGDDVTVAVEDDGGFPGDHVAHVIAQEDLSGEYEPGDTVSEETADAVQDNEGATVFQGIVEFADQTFDEPIEEGDELTVATANLFDGAGDETEFVVDVHPTDDEDELVGGEFVGSSDVVAGANDNVTVTTEQFPEDGEFNEFPITGEDDFVAMFHLVDDDSEEGDEASPGDFPVLPHNSADGPVPGGVTDDATIEAIAPAFFEVTIDEAPDEVTEGEEVTVEYTIQNTGSETASQEIEFTVDDELEDTTDSPEIGGGGHFSDDFTYTTDGDDVPEVTATVSSDNDSASVNVTVNEEDEEDGVETVETDFADDEVAEGEGNTNELTVTVEDENDDPVENEDVTFTIDQGDGEIQEEEPVQTGGDGTVTVTYEQGADDTATDTIEVTADADGVTGSDTYEVVEPEIETVEADFADDEVAEGEGNTNELTVAVEDENDDPVENEDVTFTIDQGDGEIQEEEPVQTDGSGEVTVTYEQGTDDTAGDTIEVTADADGVTGSDTYDVTAEADGDVVLQDPIVETEDDFEVTAENFVEVDDPAFVEVENEETGEADTADITEGETIDIDAADVGGISADDTITATLFTEEDGDQLDTDSVDVAADAAVRTFNTTEASGGDTVEVTLTYNDFENTADLAELFDPSFADASLEEASVDGEQLDPLNDFVFVDFSAEDGVVVTEELDMTGLFELTYTVTLPDDPQTGAFTFESDFFEIDGEDVGVVGDDTITVTDESTTATQTPIATP